MTADTAAGFPPARDDLLADDLLRTVLIQPAAPARIVGPGRRERDYLHRLSRFEGALQLERERHKQLERELETSQRVEHGCQRRLDRVERQVTEQLQAQQALQQRERRLLTVLGALQKENEILRQRWLAAEGASTPELAAHVPARARKQPGWWATWFGRGARP